MRIKLFSGDEVYELNLSPTKEEKKIPFTLRGNIDLINKSSEDDSDRIIAGYANVTIVDDDEQFIPETTLQKGIEVLLDDPHYANLMVMHGNIQIGKIIKSYGECITHVDNKGLYIVCQLRKDIKIADSIWEKILEGEIRGFSIGCEVLDDHKECDDDKCVTILDKINIFEVSICTEPVNKESGFTVISKSKFEETYGDNCMCECIDIKEESMTKDKLEEKTKETKVETKSEDEIPKETKAVKTEETKKEKTEEKQVDETKKDESTEKKSEDPETKEKSVVERLEEMSAEIQRLSDSLSTLTKADEDDDEDKPEGDGGGGGDSDLPGPPEEENFSDPVSFSDYTDFLTGYLKDNSKAEFADAVSAWKSREPKVEELEKKSADSVKEETKEEKKESAPDNKENETILSVIKSIDDLTKEINILKGDSDIQTELKARDDQILALSKKIEIITKSDEKVEPEVKTKINDSTKVKIVEEKQFVVKDGLVYKDN